MARKSKAATITMSGDIHPTTGSFHSATGPIRYTFTNDFMFKFVFQNTEILSGFLCSLLRLSPEQVKSVTLKNPIILGQHISDKTFILDISILDFTLFPEHPEFYATYKLLNVKNMEIYNDNFQLNVLQLNHTELATKEDRAYGLDHWAALFKAKTWEEIKMLSAENSAFDTVAQELYKANEDERIRLECQAREEYYFETRRRQRWLEEAQAALAQAKAELGEKSAALEEKNAALAESNAAIASLQEQIASLQAELAALKSD